MSFLFKSKKPTPGTGGLPPATRNITSAHGERTMIPTANGVNIPQGIPEERRATGREVQKTQTPTPGSSVNASLNSLQSASPEPMGIREISDVDMPVSVALHLSINHVAFLAHRWNLRPLDINYIVFRSLALPQSALWVLLVLEVQSAHQTDHNRAIRRILGRSDDSSSQRTRTHFLVTARR